MILQISWKNVWRNKLRSLVVILSVTSGIFGGVYAIAMMEGMSKQRFQAAVDNETSHIQIHHAKFNENKDAKFYIENSTQIIEEIKNMPEVKSVSGRSIFMAMANTSRANTGFMLYGINTEQEKQVTKIYETLKDSAGGYFEEEWSNQILISERVADNLQLSDYKLTEMSLENLKVKDVPIEIISLLEPLKDEKFRNKRIFKDTLKSVIGEKNLKKYEFAILSYSREFKMRSKIEVQLQAANGDLVKKTFKVSGIYKTKNMLFDETTVFVKDSEIKDLTGYDENSAHEIAIMLNNPEDVKKFAAKLKEKYPDFEVQTWGEIQPMLLMMSEWMGVYYYFFVIIILFALGFGIVNTMLMVVLERVKELGMLMAIGMNRVKVFSMIMLESVFLSVTGGIIGVIFSAILINITGKNGLDFSQYIGEGFEAMGFDSVVYPSLTMDYYIIITILVILTGIISAIYPARKALKLNPADAVRSDA